MVSRLTERSERAKEQSITVLLRELKEEVTNLRNELSRIEGSIVKERLRTVENALAQNYIMLYADQMEEGLDKNLERLIREDCGKRGRCIDSFKAYLTGLLRVIRKGELKDTLAALDAKISEVEDTVQDIFDAPCKLCQMNLLDTLRKEKRAFQKIAALEPFRKDEKIEGVVDMSFLVENVLEPLANSARLKILSTTYNGRKSFSELSEITDMRGGHLIFHLSKLLSAGLITQGEKKGDYVITSRGVDAIRKLLTLQLGNQQKQ